MAYKHLDKTTGNLISSADWNSMGHEIERLETDKVNRAGDIIKGDLSVTGKFNLGGLLTAAKSTFWNHDPYADAIGPPVASIGRLEVGGFDNGTAAVPAVLRIHQWGSGSAEFYKPRGTNLYLRETPTGGGNWCNNFEIQMNATIPVGVLGFGSKTRQMINLWNANYGIGVQTWTHYFRTDKNFAWYKGGCIVKAS